jgi:hypothetical protein
MERELLSIVETLKEFRNILLGHRIQVFTDHLNLTYVNFNTERVMRWRLILKEYGPELLYVKGENNVVADALSRLPLISSESSQDINYLADHFALHNNDLPDDIYPLQYSLIQKCQQKDKALLNKIKEKTQNYHFKSFHGGGKTRNLICYKDKIVIPDILQQKVVTWYHNTLCHSGETRTEQTIRQHFWWSNLRDLVHRTCSKCDTCQRTKRTSKKYGHLPAKEAEADPWDVLCVDLIGPYTIKRRGKKNLTLWCVTMIDPATGWFEMKEIPNKEAFTIASLIEQTWLSRYPWPTQVILDRGSEFMGEFTRMIEKDYGIKKKPITTRNPQANSILERIHQTIGNMVRTFQINKADLDENDPWSGILAAVMFATRATYHTTTQATPTQLVFGRDAILNTKFEANWRYIRQRKQELINQNNQRENKKRIPHQYKIGDKVLYRIESLAKYSGDPYEGPYEIVHVNTNGTVRLKMDAVTDTVNIRLLKPYRD